MGQHLHVQLTAAEYEQLSSLVRSGSSSARTLTRARILLLADRERQPKRSYQEIAEALLCSVSRWETALDLAAFSCADG